MIGRSSPHVKIELLVGVHQTNLAELERVLLAVSEPASPQYGQYLTNHQAHALVAPETKHVDAVLHWLRDYSPELLSPSAAWIRAKLTIQQLEQLLDTSFHQVSH